MNDHVEQSADGAHSDSSAGAYEAPRIERVITRHDLEREVMFAGPAITVTDGLPEE